MFEIDSDMTIHVTRGDIATFTVYAESNGKRYKFQPNDVVRIKVFQKKDASNVAFQKDFLILEEKDLVDLYLTEADTKIGDVISKPKDYWYEIELNPYTDPQTIVGYDDDGPKIFRLYPEGRDLSTIEREDKPYVDKELSLTSENPIQNQAVARALIEYEDRVALAERRIEETATGAEQRIEATASEAEQSIGGTATETCQSVSAFCEEAESNIGAYATETQRQMTEFSDAKKADVENYSSGVAENTKAEIAVEADNAVARVKSASDNSEESANTAKNEANRAKAEADRASAIVGGDFVLNSQTLTEPILEKALTLKTGVYHYNLAGASYTGNDLPHINYGYSPATVFVRSNGAARVVVLWGIKHDTAKAVCVNYFASGDGTWSGWFTLSTTADIEKLLNGTQQVGDSAKLGGKDASEYAFKADIFNHIPPQPQANNTSSAEEVAALYDNLHVNSPDSAWYKAKIWNSATIPILGGGTWYVEGYRTNAAYGTQIALSYAPTPKFYIRGIYDSKWSEWKRISTEVDLANCLPLSGDTPMKRNLTIGSNSANNVLWLGLINSLRNVALQLLTDGTLRLWDNTGSKELMSFGADGTNTINGTASGNLPLAGGGEVYANSAVPVKIKNASDNCAYLQVNGVDGALGYFGFERMNTPTFVTTGGTKREILHTGNSAKVAIQETAPTDGLWVW